jgi:hypothetical protein
MNEKEKRELEASEMALISLALIGVGVVIWLAWIK